MALIPASIDITFNANYVGCHRICFRLLGNPTYDCTTQVTCTGNGAPCSATIGIQIDNNSCVPVNYEGYVQACCESVDSPNGQVPFTVIFNPNPNCKGYTITCTGPGTVDKVGVTYTGSAYTPPGGTVPVTFAGGGGLGAAANANIGNGGISSQFGSVSIFPFGSGYVNGTYFNVPAVTLTGIGTGALFTVVVSGGQVVSADINPGFNGTGYLGGDTLTFNNANLGGTGSGVVGYINFNNTGEIQSVTLTNPGSGYTSVPSATVPPPISGFQATFLVVLSNCPPIDVTDCSGAINLVNAVPTNVSFVACLSSAPALNFPYVVNQDACCNNCNTITINKSDSGYGNPPAYVYYTDCASKQFIKTLMVVGGTIGPVCAVSNSWFVQESDPINGSTSITVGPVCP